MSRITFLDNACQGKNNWWRYLLTILLIVVGATVATFGLVLLIEIIYGAYLLLTNLANLDMLQSIQSFALDPLFFLIITGILYAIAMVLLFISIRFIHKRKFKSLISTDFKFDFRRVLKGAAIWSAIMLILLIVQLVMDPNSMEFTFNVSGFLILLIISLLVFPIQASFEELFFRGYLMQGFGLLTKKPIIPLILTSVIFAIGHYWNGTTATASVDFLLQALVMGITLGIIVLGENRLETAMGVHIANNIFVTVIINDPTFFGNLPSIFSSSPTPNPLIDVSFITALSVILLVLIFWNQKENLYNIFRNGD